MDEVRGTPSAEGEAESSQDSGKEYEDDTFLMKTIDEARGKRRAAKSSDVSYFFKPKSAKSRKKSVEKDASHTSSKPVEMPDTGVPAVEEPNIGGLSFSEPSEGACGTSKSVTDLNPLQSYSHLLREQNAVLMTQWIIALAKPTQQKLNLKSFVGIIKLGGNLCCSCDKSSLDTAFSSIRLSLPPSAPTGCVHLNVLEYFDDFSAEVIDEWVSPTDRISEDHLYSESNHEVIALRENTFLVYIDSSFTTVNEGKCDCQVHQGVCSAQKVVQGISDDPVWETVVKKRQTSLSWKEIPFIAGPRTMTNCSELKPKMCCACQCQELIISETPTTVPLYSRAIINNVQVYIAHCNECGNEVYADGGDIGILNMSNYLVAHDLLADYCRLFVSDSLSLSSYHKSLLWNWITLDAEVLSYAKMRSAFLAYLQLLHYGQPQEENFLCPLCGVNPEVIICDGMTLSLQKRHLKDLATFTASPELDGSKYSERIAIDNATLRKSLLACSITNDVIDAAKESHQWLVPLLTFIPEDQEDLPKSWRRLLRDLGSTTPVIGMFDQQPNWLHLLGRVIKDGISNSDDLSQLAIVAPVFYDIFSQRVEDTGIVALQKVLEHLLSRINYVLKFEPHTRSSQAPVAEGEVDGLPCLPQVYQRGTFKMDKSSLKHTDTTVCSKNAPKHKTLTPGIFTISCPHSICYGFQMMMKFESPDVLFTAIRTRFEKAPALVIYDNACNVHSYCLNRDPGFFQNTKFCVDRFHWTNHKGCSSGYDINRFPQYNNINSEVAEQGNSVLSRLRGILPYTNEENFIVYLRLFLWFRNTLRIVTMREPKNMIEQQLLLLAPYYAKKRTRH